MARLTESQLAGFRTGTSTREMGPPRPQRRPKGSPRDPFGPDPGTDQPALALDGDTPSTISILGPVPPQPTRGEARHKVGLTLPLELAEQVRALTKQGYALADLAMVAYEHHRAELVREHEAVAARQLQRRTIGRSSFTITLSVAERKALDALALQIDTTRSRTVATLLERHLSSQPSDRAPAAESPEHRSPA